jgi:hypothetical protein
MNRVYLDRAQQDEAVKSNGRRRELTVFNILIIMMIGVWGLNFYVNVRKTVMYLNFWALTLTLLYLLFVFPSSGRQVVEK